MVKEKNSNKKSECPLCHHPLGLDERQELDEELSSLVKKESIGKIKEKDEEIKELKDSKECELEKLKTRQEEEIKKLEEKKDEDIDKQVKRLKEVLDESFVKEKAHFEEENKEKVRRLIEDKKRAEQESEKLKEKVDDIVKSKLKEEEDKIRANYDKKIAESESKHRQELAEKTTQIERMNTDIETLKKSGVNKSSELVGTAGEAVLLDLLRTAFPQDEFITQKRGRNEADIVQIIKINPTHRIPSPIVYDNKVKSKITKADIEKAKGYRQVHDTNYVIIVTTEIPAESSNKLIYERDGILVVHSSVIGEFVQQYRRFIVELFKSNLSEENRLEKEKKLFDFIKSDKFTRLFSGIEDELKQLDDLQGTEEEGHSRIWTKRKNLLASINEARLSVGSEIYSITQGIESIQEIMQIRNKRKKLKLNEQS